MATKKHPSSDHELIFKFFLKMLKQVEIHKVKTLTDPYDGKTKLSGYLDDEKDPWRIFLNGCQPKPYDKVPLVKILIHELGHAFLRIELGHKPVYDLEKYLWKNLTHQQKRRLERFIPKHFSKISQRTAL